ncbi:MAG: ArsR/SmtB family transcription factor [Pseudomonadota bacterium]
MTDKDAAAALAALGHEARLSLLRLLVRAEPGGLNIGEIGRHLGMAPSTLSHHLGALVSAGLVTQEKRGREVLNRARVEALRAVFAHVEAECCLGVETPGEDAA